MKKLISEGEYSKGEKYVQGKDYNDKGQLIYEGGYSKVKKHGKGKKYNFFYNTENVGEFMEDEKKDYLKFIKMEN